jgi:hypothetical protein
VLVVVCVAATILVSMVAARLFGFQTLFGLLTGGATAICGASAALALSAALPAHPMKDRATWKKIRRDRKAIGSSLAAACLGQARMSPLEAYASIMELDPEADELYEKAFIKRGMFMEPGILQWLCYEKELDFIPSPGLLECPGIPWLVATPDGIGRCRKTGTLYALEVKKQDDSKRPEWSPEPPVPYQFQHDIAMMCARLDQGFLAADFGRGELHIVERVRNDVLLEIGLDELALWREAHLVPEIPPDVTASEGSGRIFKVLHPKDNGSRVVLSADATECARRFDEAQAEIKKQEAIESAAKARIMQELGDNTFGVMPDGSGFSFKTQVSNFKATEARTVETRVLRRVKKV